MPIKEKIKSKLIFLTLFQEIRQLKVRPLAVYHAPLNTWWAEASCGRMSASDLITGFNTK